ncbi:MAG: hypothetical protein H6672_23160, partial [Anaerolineaceae bacterium]|nr:hypothetical protein [Anaerolineaceae bacterium]
MLRKKSIVISLLVIGILTVIANVLTTHWGIGVRPDSASYLNAARNLVDGNGLTITFQSLEPIPLLWFAPAYSFVLAAASPLFGTPIVAAFWIQTLFFVGSIFLVALAVYTCTENTYATIVGAAIMASAPDVMFYHQFVMTEPAFIFFCLLTWLLLARYLQTNQRSMLILSA